MAENYKYLYEQMKKMVEKYQDEIVPGLRKLVESRVEVVRCKDCKHTGTDGCGAIYCEKWDRWEIPEDFFCGYGERRADDATG